VGERRYSSYSFLTLALDRVEWSTLHPNHPLSPGKGPPGNHGIGGWVGPRASLDTEVGERILCWGLNPDRVVVQSIVRHFAD
jgi:hypothetical protein